MRYEECTVTGEDKSFRFSYWRRVTREMKLIGSIAGDQEIK